MPIFNRGCGKLAGVTGATWAIEVAAAEGLEFGAVERGGGVARRQGNLGCASGADRAISCPLRKRMEHHNGFACGVGTGISDPLYVFFSEARCRALRVHRMVALCRESKRLM